MFVIRRAQLDVLSANTGEDLEKRLVTFLQTEFDDAAQMPADELLGGVRLQVRKACSYGFDTDQGIAIYVTAAFMLGEDFDTEFPAAHAQLASPDRTPTEKADWLVDWNEKLFQGLEKGA